MTGKAESTLHWLLIIGIFFKVKGGGTMEANAYVNFSYFNLQQNSNVTLHCECGLFGLNSPLAGAQGVVGIPVSPNLQSCDLHTKFSTTTKPWIALIERGNCTFSEKILLAASKGAEAVVIYNAPSSTGNQTIPMVHYGTKNTIAIMIGYLKGSEIAELIRSQVQVTMVIEVGKKHGSWVNHYSIFFVSISFFVVTAATVGYFIFYSARRWRHTRAQNQKMKQLKDEAKKAINQLQLRTIKQGDKVLGPDGDSCAVCIESYKANDVVRILTCNHFFHKNCIDPWLLEHRTCPMCKCDILKSLGIAADEEEPENTIVISSVSNELQRSSAQVEDETHSDNASSGYASVRGADEVVEEPEHTYENEELVNHDSSTMATDVLPHLDNPAFENEYSTHVHNVKS
ncbi:E3 ubiquitin-protein ligase RNF128 isoform X2 [Hyperolius riggenbachi]|uniref:E3 ubiquitin-protein ligase RNF128 isoform X2 n=1 Tax=Hyperolius riggenbachi TaxID=752182 RepID=UPI0035A284C3